VVLLPYETEKESPVKPSIGDRMAQKVEFKKRRILYVVVLLCYSLTLKVGGRFERWICFTIKNRDTPNIFTVRGSERSLKWWDGYSQKWAVKPIMLSSTAQKKRVNPL
jgi:hypothetical protein